MTCCSCTRHQPCAPWACFSGFPHVSLGCLVRRATKQFVHLGFMHTRRATIVADRQQNNNNNNNNKGLSNMGLSTNFPYNTSQFLSGFMRRCIGGWEPPQCLAVFFGKFLKYFQTSNLKWFLWIFMFNLKILTPKSYGNHQTFVVPPTRWQPDTPEDDIWRILTVIWMGLFIFDIGKSLA